MDKLYIHITSELRRCLDKARKTVPLGPFIEKLLRQSPAIKKAASELEIEFEPRESDGRGKWKQQGE